MDVVVVMSKNILDVSKIQEVGQNLPHQVITCNSNKKILHMFLAGPGDRRFIVIFDYYMYEESNLNDVRAEINKQAKEHKINPVEYRSFVPHEKIVELTALYPDVTFIPRSKFFQNLKTYLE